ncbi:MAG TPA: lipid-A-disaccharide synthase N-terminal domain-containing protein, partial [Thermoanaerobaculia bacterium]|nr:lipid-A-disaccharide synthase N-terminal domain-containing protein [Thermoanaerobaculia bacterium]
MQLHVHSVWTVIGFFGQALFFGRFFVQWLASERAKRSVIPSAFWYFSLGGG